MRPLISRAASLFNFPILLDEGKHFARNFFHFSIDMEQSSFESV